jgi:molybdopterin/thiamine biosynthesis adenylyltransferase
MADLTDQELERYARHIVLPRFGGAGQNRLKSASVTIIGAGGIGSGVIPALAAAGVGKLTIIDNDQVDRSNLQRQPIFRDDQVGGEKAKLAAAFATAVNPHVEAVARERRIDAANAEELLGGHDLVLDGSDNFATRLAVSDVCVALGIPLVSASAVQFQGQVGLFRGRPCYRCFVGDAFDSDECDNCAELGVLGALPLTIGSFAALLAIRAIAGMGEDSGTLHLFDADALGWRAIRLPADPGCRTCGAPPQSG